MTKDIKQKRGGKGGKKVRNNISAESLQSKSNTRFQKYEIFISNKKYQYMRWFFQK